MGVKDTMVEGVPDSKIKRLQGHLLKAEELSGHPLYKKPKRSYDTCPIENFAYQEKVCFGVWGGKFEKLTGEIIPIYELYKLGDSYWWGSLSRKTRLAITKYISNWIRERQNPEMP
jgi:hypothetical protein